MQVAIGPGASMRWIAAPGEEFVDPINHRKIIGIEAYNNTGNILDIVVWREDHGSVFMTPEPSVHMYTNGTIFIYPPTDRLDRPELPEPEFDLSEIHAAKELVERE